MTDVAVEIQYDGAWHDITEDVRVDTGIRIARGRRDWATLADPSTCALKLHCSESNVVPGVFGRYSPRNPLSDLYGKIGRNTPLRVRRGTAAPRLDLPGVETAYASTPDTSSLDIVGDIDLRIDARTSNWAPADITGLARKYHVTSDERSWLWGIGSGGMFFRWSPDGTIAAAITVTSSALPFAAGDRGALRVTLDVNNGASGNTVTWYTAPTIAGPWTQLGSPVVTAGVTSIYSGTAPVEVGRVNPGGLDSVPFTGEMFAFEVRTGIAGTLRANPIFDAQDPTTTVFTDSPGRTWTLNGSAAITDPQIRFCGELASLPQAWDMSEKLVWSSAEAAGILRRLQKGKTPLRSSLFRDFSTKANVVAYWPLEEPSGAQRWAAGRARDRTTLNASGVPGLVTPEVKAAGFDGYVASAPIPTIKVGTITGAVPAYAGDSDQRIVCLLALPQDLYPSSRHVLRVNTSGTVQVWDLSVASTGDFVLRAYNDSGVTIVDSGALAAGAHGRMLMLSLWLQQSGSTINWQIATWAIGDTVAGTFSGSLASNTYERITRVQLGDALGMEDAGYGHVAILNDDVQSIWDVVNNSLDGWAGEEASARLTRLGADEGLPIRVLSGDTAVMGPQRVAKLLDLIREAPAVDLGMLNERPDAPGLLYRPRVSLYNQSPKLVLDYTDEVISGPFQPDTDDQHILNDITVSRPRGSSYEVAQETGPLSVQPPPDGVGPYDHSADVNVETDEHLPDHAGWRLRLGTVDEERFSRLRINLASPATAAIKDDVLSLTEGDVVRIENLPAWMAPDAIDLIVDGITEEIGEPIDFVEFACSPASPWTVGVRDDSDLGRRGSAGSSLASGVTSSATSWSVATPVGLLWATSGIFPFDMVFGGELVTVTAVSGASSPQTFTVTRAVNGIVKAHPSGTTGELAQSAARAL